MKLRDLEATCHKVEKDTVNLFFPINHDVMLCWYHIFHLITRNRLGNVISSTESYRLYRYRNLTLLQLNSRYVSNNQPHDCLFNRLFGCRTKKTSKLRVTGLCEGNSPVTGEFPAQKVSDAKNVAIWRRHHATKLHHRTIHVGKVELVHVFHASFINISVCWAELSSESK